MSAPEAGPDAVVACVAAAFSKARIVTAVLRDTVIPSMSTARRTFSERLLRRVERRDIFSEELVHDIDSLVLILKRQIDEATVVGWQADENHNAGGYEVITRSEDAMALAGPVRGLEELRDLVCRALDVVRAEAIAADLLSS